MSSDGHSQGGGGPPTQAAPRPRILPLNARSARGDDQLPLSACDCDNHVPCTVHCAVGDVDVDVDACGIWG